MDHLNQNLLISDQFLRIILKFFPFGCHDNQNSAWNGILNNFERGPSKYHSCEVKLFRRCLKEIVDRQTDGSQ